MRKASRPVSRGRRGLLLGGLAAILGPRAVSAQPTAKVARVGVLASSTEENFAPNVTGFRGALAATGWVEGRNLTLGVRYPGEQYAHLPELAAGAATCSPSHRGLGADRLTARPAHDTRSTMSVALTGGREPVDTKPPMRRPAGAHDDRFALNEDSPYLLPAAAVVQKARVDQAHHCSSNCSQDGQCRRAALSARRFLTALRTSKPAWGGVWLEWLEYAAVRAGLTPRRRRGYSP